MITVMVFFVTVLHALIASLQGDCSKDSKRARVELARRLSINVLDRHFNWMNLSLSLSTSLPPPLPL